MADIWFTSGRANIRSAPFEDPNNILTTLSKHHPVTVLETEGEWFTVQAAFRNRFWKGFIHSSLLKLTGGYSHPEIQHKGIPERDRLFSDPESAALKPYLIIRPPSETARATEALNIRRSRRLEVNWAFIQSPRLLDGWLNKTSSPFVTSDNFDYFFNHWRRLWGAEKFSLTQKLPSSNFFKKVNVVTPIQLTKKLPNGNPYTETVWSPPENLYVIDHPNTTRHFALRSHDGQTIDNADLETWGSFKALLQEKIASIEQCVEETEAALHPTELTTEMEFVDLGPAIIIRQFGELQAIESFTETLASQADQLASSAVNELLNEQQVNNLIQAVLTMKTPSVDRKLRLAELIDNAAALGYILPTAPKTINFEDGSTETLLPGELYSPYLEIITWTTEHKRQSSSSSGGFFGIGSHSSSREWTEIIRHQKTVQKNRKLKVDLDPFYEREQLLNAQGFVSFRMERHEGRYRTGDGLTLEDLMERCEYDESFKRACALWMPIYEQKLSKGILLTGYRIFKRPGKGIRPIKFPEFFLEETLSYRTSWENTELGEVIYTMNLAPGEERNINIEQKTTRSTENINATVSILDLTQTASQDLSSEIEKEARTTRDQSSSSSWSASASGSYGSFSGSASSSGENRSSTSHFARNFEKLAQKAASNLTKNTKQEVRTSSTVKTDAARIELTSIKIKNINEGRTLNLLFYRLYNILSSAIHLDDLLLLDQPGIEVVSGSGMVSQTLNGAQGLAQALRTFSWSSLPFKPSFEEGTVEYTALFRAYWAAIVDKLCDVLEKEYLNASRTAGVAGGPPLRASNAAIKEFRKKLTPSIVTAALSEDELQDNLDKLLVELEELFADLVASSDSSMPEPIRKSLIRVASPGLYVDSIMGARPATEPYAEEMRAQTVRLRAAEAAKEYALASYYERLGSEQRLIVDSTRLSMIDAAAVSNSVLQFDFEDQSPSGHWIFEVDGIESFNFQRRENERRCMLTSSGEFTFVNDLEGHAYLLKHSSSETAYPIVIRDAR